MIQPMTGLVTTIPFSSVSNLSSDMKPPSQQVSKTGDDALHELEHYIERFKQRLTRHNLRLVDRYIKGELHLALELHDSRFDVDYIAYLQRFDGAAKVGMPNQAEDSGVTLRHRCTHP